MSIYTLVLIATFGRGSMHPRRATLIRLGLMATMAIGLGGLVAQGVTGLEPPAVQLTDLHLLFATSLVVQGAVVFALGTSLGIIRAGSADILTKIFLLLPLQSRQRWIALLLPSGVVTLATLAVIFWPLVSWMVPFGLHPILFLLGSIIGAIAGLGVMHGIVLKWPWLQIALTALLLWVEYVLLQSGLHANQGISILSYLGMFLLFTVLWWLFWRSSDRLNRDITKYSLERTVHGVWLPPSLWFVKKVVRATNSRVSMATAIGMSAVLAYIFYRFAFTFSAFILTAAILAAATASDIRSLCRRRLPPEITMLRGTASFINTQTATTLLCSLVAVSPLLIMALVADGSGFHLRYIGQYLLGVCVGIFAGTLIVPAPRDVLAQLVATLLCSILLIGIPLLPILGSLGTIWLGTVEVVAAGLLLALAWAIEYQRNHYAWRK